MLERGMGMQATSCSAVSLCTLLTACVPGEVDAPTREKIAACTPRFSVPTTAASAASNIEHLVVILQENHSFDSYFGRYCQGVDGTTCNTGPGCCEAAPTRVGKCEADAHPLDDARNGATSPNHDANVWYEHMHWHKGTFQLDRFPCDSVTYAAAFPSQLSSARYPDIAAPDDTYPLRTYHQLATSGALADRYFQPIIGASSSNDMFFARAAFVFQDNQAKPKVETELGRAYLDTTIVDLLDEYQVSFRVYSEGFDAWCAGDETAYPDGYDASDNPFNYYPSTYDRSVDYANLEDDLNGARLPAVSFVRALGVRSEHPGSGTTLRDGQNFVREVIQAIAASPEANSTLILITWDEGGGYYDHVQPPALLADGTPLPRTPLHRDEVGDRSTIARTDHKHGKLETLPQSKDDPEYYSKGSDMNGQQHYGTRVPLLAVGPFAKRNYISHRVMEHSSIVRFIEWNWLGNARLGTRDLHVNGIGDLLDPEATGVVVND